MNFLRFCPCGTPRTPQLILCKDCWDTAPDNDKRDFKRKPRGVERWDIAKRLRRHALDRKQRPLL